MRNQFPAGGGFPCGQFVAGLGGSGAPAELAPLLSDLFASGDEISFASDEAGTAYWLIDNAASYADADALIAASGSGAATGTFAAVQGANSASLDVSGVADGTYSLHVGVRDAAGNASNVLTDTDVVIDAPSTAMEDDVGALFWYNPESSYTEGTGGNAGKVVSITDATGNGYNLDTLASGATYPELLGNGKLYFDGTAHTLMSSVNGPIVPAIDAGTSVAIIMTLTPYVDVDYGVLLERYVLAERNNAGSGGADTTRFGVKLSGASVTAAFTALSRNTAGSNAFDAETSGFTFDGTTSLIVTWIINPAGTLRLRVEGVEQTLDNNTITSGNIPSVAVPITLGSNIDGAGVPFRAFRGEVSHVYAVEYTDDTQIAAIEDQQAAKENRTL
ncbi:hypothetical protein [Pseudooceanicola nitratireducens]|uniref:hypothetical protein n=1 Tax=Pseudooceanicola nitratireducens TaxID=517719 RepID=UPI003C7BCAB8